MQESATNWVIRDRP